MVEPAVGTVGIVGFGRFGRSLGELMAESGIDVRAFDPHAPVPEPFAAASLGALVRASQIVILAVPVPALEAVVESASALLTGSQVVLDVASVKVKPVELFDRHLAERVPWRPRTRCSGRRASPAASGRSTSWSARTIATPALSTRPRASTPGSVARSGCRTRSRTTGRWPARTRWGS